MHGCLEIWCDYSRGTCVLGSLICACVTHISPAFALFASAQRKTAVTDGACISEAVIVLLVGGCALYRSTRGLSVCFGFRVSGRRRRGQAEAQSGASWSGGGAPRRGPRTDRRVCPVSNSLACLASRRRVGGRPAGGWRGVAARDEEQHRDREIAEVVLLEIPY